jgi:HEAT repeat protein
MPPAPREWLIQAAKHVEALIVIDALDELAGKQEVDKFKLCSPALGRLKARLIATCRTLHWDERRPWLGWSEFTDVELAPFERPEQREFSRKFPPGVGARGLERLLASNYPLRQACSSPLLLAFVCLLLAEGENLSGANRITVYTKTVRRLLSGDWRNVTPPWQGNKVLSGKILKFLEKAALAIFQRSPEENRFTLSDWERAGSEPVPELLSELDRCGLVVAAGEDNLGDDCWSFLHRSLLEFFAGRALARQPQSVWLEKAKKHFWYEPEWIEVLTFLAAHVTDATPIIVALEQEEEDIFFSVLYLRVRLASASRRVEQGALRVIASEVETLFQEILLGSGEQEVLEAILPLASIGLLGEVIAGSLINVAIGARQSREQIARVLGQMGNARAVDALLDLVGDESAGVREWAAWALGRLGDARAVDPLLGLLGDGYARVRKQAAWALGSLGDARALDALLELLGDKAPEVREQAARALSQLEETCTVLQELLGDESADLHGWAALMLGQMGDLRAFDILLELLSGENSWIRGEAASVLGVLNDARAVNSLLGLLEDEDMTVRWKAALALGQLGETRAFNGLITLLSDKEWEIRLNAVEALAQLGDRRAVDALVVRLEDENERVREWAAKALGRLGDLRAVDALLSLLAEASRRPRGLAVFPRADWDASVRESAAEALGRLKDPRAVDALLETLRSADWPWIRARAGLALAEFGDMRGLDSLVGLLRESWTMFPTTVIKALRKFVEIDRTIRLPRHLLHRNPADERNVKTPTPVAKPKFALRRKRIE